VLLFTPAFTFSHDGLAAGKKQKGESKFGNEISQEQYWQFVLLLTPAFTFPMMAWRQERNKKM
jgi:hypothetical protein